MTRLEIRLDPETKSNLDFLARITGQNMSELIRNVVIPIARIKTTINTIKTIELTEKALVRAIVQLPEFQQLLEELQAYMMKDYISVGYGGTKMYCDNTLFGEFEYKIVKNKDGKLTVVKLFENEECNEYGTCWRSEYAPFTEREIETLSELAEFLEYVVEKLAEELEEKIEKVKEAIKRLIQ